MKIESLSPLSSAPLHRKGRSSGNGASNFASQLTGDVAGPRSVSGATAVTPRTAAILPVHFAGRPCNMDRIVATLNVRRGEIDDPRLGEVADEIELRAAVELAKLGR